jgi:hypothetical protein
MFVYIDFYLNFEKTISKGRSKLMHGLWQGLYYKVIVG